MIDTPQAGGFTSPAAPLRPRMPLPIRQYCCTATASDIDTVADGDMTAQGPLAKVTSLPIWQSGANDCRPGNSRGDDLSSPCRPSAIRRSRAVFPDHGSGQDEPRFVPDSPRYCGPRTRPRRMPMRGRHLRVSAARLYAIFTRPQTPANRQADSDRDVRTEAGSLHKAPA